MRRTRANRLAAIALLITAIAAPFAQAYDKTPKNAVVIPLGLYLDAIPSIHARVGGEDRVFLFDTAGGITAVTPQTAQTMACVPWGQITGHRMRGDRVDMSRCDNTAFEIAGISFALPTAGVFDFSKLLPPNAPPLAGSIALDAFAGRAITMDLAAGQLILETPSSLKRRVRDATEVPVRFSREAQGFALTPFVAVETKHGYVWMELDCGSDGAVIIGKHLADLFNLDTDVKGKQPIAMKLANGIALESEASVQNLILDGNIGAPVLRRWIVTLDLAEQRLWIKQRDSR